MDDELERFIEKYCKSIYSFCYYLTENKTDAEDLCQETFLRAWEKREGLPDILGDPRRDGGPVSEKALRNYLFGIASHLWKNQYRKRQRRRSILPEDDREAAMEEAVSAAPGPEQEILHRETLMEVERQVRSLPDKLRLVVVMFYTGQMSTGEIARQLKIPEATVRSRLSRARKRLRGELERKRMF